MTVVTGFFEVQVDGAVTRHTFTDMPYTEFWMHQNHVLKVLNETSDWGLESILGVPPTFSGDANGNVSYNYIADFSEGGNSTGSNVWNGIPSGASAYLGTKLNAAFP